MGAILRELLAMLNPVLVDRRWDGIDATHRGIREKSDVLWDHPDPRVRRLVLEVRSLDGWLVAGGDLPRKWREGQKARLAVKWRGGHG